ncbi:TPA: hypothetical protein LA742_002113 [Clostridium botulinum]|uniref:hypothetical protein n=1 Tax=Clostridium TaxID=1485 RepID=UPI0007733841|nr:MULTISPECIES: hypothetical protein [Clostridium]AUM94252.1 hypothetical protein RSJ11_03400 [Clostridium sporogenes]AVQ51677.1 hypothetical protein C7M59_01900 [Clostridium botulinum]HBJ2613644.1 hypothetical protein [Clostridium botulinum]
MNYKCMSKKVASLVIIGSMLSSSAVYAAGTIKKDESVYVTLNQNGVIKEKIVSDWLHSENAGISIKDKSELTGIKNIKGNEKPEISGDKVTWKSDKKDIFYQGKTDKKLPIETDIVYKLDGKEIKPQELAGKSGKVTINIKIKNTDAHKVTVNGKERTIYTPFAVAAVVNLPIDKFTNVDVSEGEIISDGNNQAITFVTVPGLKESLNVDENILDIDLKDEIEITADAKDFELAPIMMTATTKIPEMDKIEKSDKIDELQNGINDIKDATSKLEDGSSKLADGSSELAKGLGTLSNGTGELVSGSAQLYAGTGALAQNMNKFNGAIGQLQSGSGTLAGGIKQYTGAVNTAKNGAGKLNAGVPQLSKGANDLGKGSVDYSNGAKKFANGASELAETVKSKSGELASNTNKLQDGSTKLEAGAKDINNNVAKINGGLGNLVKNTETIKARSQNLVGAMDQGVNTAAQLKDAKQSEIEGINAALANMESLREVANSIENSEQKSAMLAKINTEIATLQGMRNSSSQIVGGLSKLEGGLGEAKTGAENLNGGIAKLQQGQNELYEGSQKLYNGTNDLSNNMSNLTKGVEDLNSGVSNLNPTLGAAVGKLNEGANGLGKASSSLMEGSNKFVSGSKEAVAGIKGLYSGLSAIDSKSNDLVAGSNKLNGGLSAAKGATSQLSAGAGKLSMGAGQLNAGTNKLNSGANKLGEGANKVAQGNKELSVNMTKFNNEGVKKIDDKLGTKITDVKEILDVKDEIVNLSKNYGTFTGLGDDMEGNVKFIMRTDEIKKPKEEEPKKKEKASTQDKASAQKQEKGGIGNWIKNLFS